MNAAQELFDHEPVPQPDWRTEALTHLVNAQNAIRHGLVSQANDHLARAADLIIEDMLDEWELS